MARKATPPADVERLAQAAREGRARECFEAIQSALKAHRCTIRLDVLIGEQAVPLATVLAFPGKIAIIPD